MEVFLFAFSRYIMTMLLNGVEKLQTDTEFGLKLHDINGLLLDIQSVKILLL